MKSESAYPSNPNEWTFHSGLTKREAYALAAMQGLCANSRFDFEGMENVIAIQAFKVALAMEKESEGLGL